MSGLKNLDISIPSSDSYLSELWQLLQELRQGTYEFATAEHHPEGVHKIAYGSNAKMLSMTPRLDGRIFYNTTYKQLYIYFESEGEWKPAHELDESLYVSESEFNDLLKRVVALEESLEKSRSISIPVLSVYLPYESNVSRTITEGAVPYASIIFPKNEDNYISFYLPCPKRFNSNLNSYVKLVWFSELTSGVVKLSCGYLTLFDYTPISASSYLKTGSVLSNASSASKGLVSATLDLGGIDMEEGNSLLVRINREGSSDEDTLDGDMSVIGINFAYWEV